MIQIMLHNHTPRKSSSSKSPVAASQRFAMESLEERKLMAVGPWVPFAQIIGQDQTFAAYPYLDGSNQTVALVDRGVDYRHPQLGNGAAGPGQKVIGGYNFRDNTYNILDDYGHGTGVAGIIASDPYTYGGYNQGVAASTHLLMLKQESSANIKAALDFVIQYHSHYNIQVINLTDFVSEVLPNSYNPDLYTSELKTLHDLGIFIVTPVGNGETFNNPAGNHVGIGLPASSPYVYGAGGITPQDTMWPDSRRGAGLDILAPSSNVTMTYYLANKVNGVGVNGYDQYDDNYTGTRVLANYAQGTSWASAYVAGTATLIKQINPAFTPDQIAQIISSTGDPVADNEDPSVSYPRLNIKRAVDLAFQMADDPYVGNTNFATATSLPYGGGVGSLGNLKFVIGHPDNFAFNVTKKQKVQIKVPYAGKGAYPFVLLFDQNQHIVAQIGAGGLKTTLAPGAYFIYVSATQTLPGTYGVSIKGGSAFARAVAAVVPAVVRSAFQSAATFSSTPIASATTAGNVLFTKKDTAVFA